MSSSCALVGGIAFAAQLRAPFLVPCAWHGYDASRPSLESFCHVNKVCLGETCICVIVRNGPNREGIFVTMKMCVCTHEHPGTRRCTTHSCTPTTTLTQNTTHPVNSVHIRTSLAALCYCLLRVCGCALLNPCCSKKKGRVVALGILHLSSNVPSKRRHEGVSSSPRSSVET